MSNKPMNKHQFVLANPLNRELKLSVYSMRMSNYITQE